MSDDRELGLQAITRMRIGLQAAESIIRDAEDSRWWLIWSMDAEPLGCESFNTTEELAAKLNELRQFQADVFVFYGRRLRMMTKPYLALFDGADEIKLQDINKEFANQLPPPDPPREVEAAPATPAAPTAPAPTEPAYVPAPQPTPTPSST